MENKFIRVDEVADELGVSKPYAYKLIRQLNEELKGDVVLDESGVSAVCGGHDGQASFLLRL